MEKTDTNTTQKRKVLVVDDDANLRKPLVDILEASGYEVISATDGDEGLKKAIEIKPDVTLLDVMMPKLNGWQVLDELRKDEWGKGAKVIMLTSLGQIENVAHALDKKVFNYIVKSDLKMEEIPKMVESMIRG